MSQELAAIKARVQEMEMEEETERLKEERCDAAEMHLLTSSSRPGETARGSYPNSWFVIVVTPGYSKNTGSKIEEASMEILIFFLPGV